MRGALLVVTVLFLAACSRGGSTPKWPERADRDDDGGESIAPSPGAVAFGSSDSDDEKPTAESAAKPAASSDAKPAETTATPATPTSATPAVITAPEEVINLDDIVIEIED